MAANNTKVQTVQSGIKKYESDFIKNYSLFLGGLSATQKSLEQYDPFKQNYARIFFVKMPVFMEKIMPDETKRIRHLLEYGFTGISGINNTSLDMEQITGGYAGRQFDVANVAKNETNSITINTYEFAGSPVREYLDTWITGISDPHTGLSHYHGASEIDSTIKYSQANHVAEAVYVLTDATGKNIEFACMLSNMMPKAVPMSHLNYESGSHPTVPIEIEFSTVMYQSPQINAIATALINKFQIMRNYLEFDSEYTTNDVQSLSKYRKYNWPSQYNTNTVD